MKQPERRGQIIPAPLTFTAEIHTVGTTALQRAGALVALGRDFLTQRLCNMSWKRAGSLGCELEGFFFSITAKILQQIEETR